jgi:YVTN family beta-propeller protein
MKRYLKNIEIHILIVSLFYLIQSDSDLYSQDRIYVGEKICRSCHHLQGNRDQFNPWRMSRHARAYTSLFKPEAIQIAELSGIDITPHESPICLGCHTTAYNEEDWERDPSFNFEDGVQCELCHGPGSDYIDEDIMRNPEKSRKAGLKFPKERDCLICHKEKNSHQAVLKWKPFNYNSALMEISHPGRGGDLNPELRGNSKISGNQHYTGSLVCIECHRSSPIEFIYSKWHQSAHSTAYASLSGKRAELIAEEMGISQLPQQSPLCLKCHSTGADQPEKMFSDGFDSLQGVQCESCHGPAGSHIAAVRDEDSDGPFLDQVKNNKAICIPCHTGDIHGYGFDYNAMVNKIDHSKWPQPEQEIIYKTPFNLALTNDGKRLFVACEASNSLIVVDPVKDEVLAEIPIGMQPHHVCLSPDESRVYVSNRASDNVSVVDINSYDVLSEIAVGDEPHEMAITPDGRMLYVANAGTYDVSVVDLQKEKEIKRLAASRGPWGTVISEDGRYVYVSNNLPRYGEFRTTSKSEVTVIDTRSSTIKLRHTLVDANLVQGIAVAPNDDFVVTTLIHTKNLIPMTRNMQGWIITNGIGIIWPDGTSDQLLLDQLHDFFADPTDVEFSREGKYLFVSGGGVQEIAVIDVSAMKTVLNGFSKEDRKNVLPNHLGTSTEYIIKRIKVGQSPRGMVVSADNKYLYVADGLDDAISVIDIDQLRKIKVIDLGGPKEITQARYGERIFHSAENTYIRQFSCHSCHPDGGIDGLTYDIEPDGLGYNPVDNRTLRGINDTAPFKWTGKNPTLQRQCGPRLAAFFTRIDPFTKEQSAALDRYIVTIPRPPNRYRTGEKLTQVQRRGKRIFEREYDNSGNPIPDLQRCNYCHTYPYFTTREKFDVGTSSWLDTQGTFDVPHLNNIYATPPYLHDGRAQSLDEIWTVYNQKDKHGLTNDLTKDQLNDLIEYLKTL